VGLSHWKKKAAIEPGYLGCYSAKPLHASRILFRQCGFAVLSTALQWLLVHSASAQAFHYQNGAIIRGPKASKTIAIAFTGHEFAEGGETILTELARHQAKASFFLTGDFLANTNHRPLVERIINEGHYLGPHSDKHLLYCSWEAPPKTLITRDQFRSDLESNLKRIEAFGVQRNDIRFFLPPYEHYNEEIAHWTHEMGLTLINYSPGTRSNADYTGENDKNFASSENILQSILKLQQQGPSALNGFVLLLHIGSGPGRKDKFHSRFGEMMDRLAREYRFVRIDELLRESPPAKAPATFIRANQLGYFPNSPKKAIAFSSSALRGNFTLLELPSGKTAFQSKLKPLEGVKWGTNEHHAELDFSPFRKEGRYQLQIGDTLSLPFEIRKDVYSDMPDRLLASMREQRCGYNPWLDAFCHTNDGRTAFGPRTNGTCLDARGGWHDAADLLKYLLTSGNATAQMLLAYELASPKSKVQSSKSSDGDIFPKTDKVNASGQPGANGIPDILDEARWGLDWMLKLHPSPDELYHQVADDRDHAGWRLPEDESLDYGWGPAKGRVVYFADGKPQGLQQYKSQSSGVANLAGRYAAAMALAYQVWCDDPRQRPFAECCLQAGKELYEMGRKQEGVQQGNSYKAPYRYEETTWADDMEWGAAELFRATRELHYLQQAKRYARLAADESWMGKEQTGHYQYYPFMNAGHFRLYDLVDRNFKKLLAQYYRDGVERCVVAGQTNPYHVGVPFIWCSNNLLAALATQCLVYERMTGDSQYHDFGTKQVDWLLGRNPWGYTMFTEIGTVCPRDPHLMTRQITKRPVSGGLVDGPVYERIFKSLKGVSIVEPDPLASFQGQAVFHDDYHDYSTDEPTMDGTASAILLFAVLTAQ
jgi:peptidoglycan/xylan/chitin deacetylase (PgdA/CDA1 family)